jgi:plastocyanin
MAARYRSRANLRYRLDLFAWHAEYGRVVGICSVLACVAVLAAAPAALGADHQIVASPSTATFSPNDLTIAPGDQVTISYAGGGLSHNSHYDDQVTGCPPTATTSAWSCPRTFTALGNYSFHCDLHATMTATVHVVDPSSVPPPPSGGPPPAEPPPPGSITPAPDVTSPAIVLGGATTQRVLRQGAVLVRVRTNEAATLAATGTVSVPPPARVLRLRKSTAASAAGEVVTLRLKLSRRTRAALTRALALRRKLRASVRITATDAAGNQTVSSRRVRLRR